MAWQSVAQLGALPEGKLISAQAGRLKLVLIRREDAIEAISSRCPHQGADLSEGLLTGHVDGAAPGCLTLDASRFILRCPWHGFEFDVETGETLAAPPEHRRLRLRRYAVRVVDDTVEVDV